MMRDDLWLFVDNWRRWARSTGGPARYQCPLGRMYVPSKDELEGNGEWVSRATPAKIPIDVESARKTEVAILDLPREPFDQPRLIVYHFLMPGHRHSQNCRRMRVKTWAYDESLAEALRNLQKELGL